MPSPFFFPTFLLLNTAKSPSGLKTLKNRETMRIRRFVREIKRNRVEFEKDMRFKEVGRLKNF